MSDFDTTILNPPDKPSLACVDCGVAVPIDVLAPVETLTAYGRMHLMIPSDPNSPPIIDERAVEMKMSVCVDCLKRRSRTNVLLDAHPRVVQPLGMREYAFELVDAAMVVLDALGVSWASIVENDKEMRLLLEHLPRAGSSARWVARFVPYLTVGVQPGQIASARERWAHVDAEQMQRLRDAYGAFMRARVDTPRPVPPPAGDGLNEAVRGCLLCGVGTVQAFSSEALHVWGDTWQAVPATLGGNWQPEPIWGYLCPTCRGQAEVVGALGLTVLYRSLLAHLGVDPGMLARFEGAGDSQQGLTIDGVQAWCVLPAGTTPNATPWAHLGDLGELREAAKVIESQGPLTRIA